MTTKSQEERAQILSSTAAIGIASRACESYVQRLMNVNAEAMNFVSSRLRQDVELGESFARCKSWADVNELQQAWGRKAVEDYMSMSQKIMELTSQMADNPWATTQGVDAVSKPAQNPAEPVSISKSESTPERASKRKSTPKRASNVTAASTAKRTGAARAVSKAKPAAARAVKRPQKA